MRSGSRGPSMSLPAAPHRARQSTNYSHGVNEEFAGGFNTVNRRRVLFRTGEQSVSSNASQAGALHALPDASTVVSHVPLAARRRLPANEQPGFTQGSLSLHR